MCSEEIDLGLQVSCRETMIVRIVGVDWQFCMLFCLSDCSGKELIDDRDWK